MLPHSPRECQVLKKDLANAFLSTHAFKWDPVNVFTLASGIKSPYYVDCRVLLAHPGPRQLVAQLAAEHLSRLKIDCIGGLESARAGLRSFRLGC